MCGKKSMERVLTYTVPPEYDGIKLNGFLRGCGEEQRAVFVRRYWYADSIPDIARRFQTRKNNVSVTLMRIRKSLREHLTERGYDL